jgi:hypothetical protein
VRVGEPGLSPHSACWPPGRRRPEEHQAARDVRSRAAARDLDGDQPDRSGTRPVKSGKSPRTINVRTSTIAVNIGEQCDSLTYVRISMARAPNVNSRANTQAHVPAL